MKVRLLLDRWSALWLEEFGVSVDLRQLPDKPFNARYSEGWIQALDCISKTHG